MRVHRVIFSFLLGFLFCACLLSGDNIRQAQAAGDLDDNTFRDIRLDLVNKHWVVRSFAAIEAGKYNDEYRMVSRLRQHYEIEKHGLVQDFVIQALSKMDRDLLVLGLDNKFLSAQIKKMAKAKNEFDGDVAVALMNKVMNVNFEKNVGSWVGFWRKKKSSYKKERKKALEAYESANGPLKEDPEKLPRRTSGAAPGEGSAVLPADLGSAIKDLNKRGLDIAILLDDTGSMGDTIKAAKSGIVALMGALKDIAPNYRIGLVSFKDKVNRTQDLTADTAVMQKILKSLNADGGDDIPEAVSLAFDYAYDKFSWKEGVTKIMVVVGDAPGHDRNKAGLLVRIKEAVGKGFTLHAINVNTFPNTSGYFSEIARAGNGTATNMTDQSELLTRIVTSLFGKQYADYTKPFCEGLVRYKTSTRKRR